MKKWKNEYSSCEHAHNLCQVQSSQLCGQEVRLGICLVTFEFQTHSSPVFKESLLDNVSAFAKI